MAQTLQQLRASLREQRKALSPERRSELSLQLTQRLLNQWDAWGVSAQGLKIALYRPQDSEPNLDALIQAWQSQGAQLCFPAISQQGVTLEMKWVEQPEVHPWRIGAFGIQEPAETAPLVPPEALDLIVVPGLAFGPHGERMGQGKGFYDRYLKQFPEAVPEALPTVLKLALGYDFQLLSQLEQSPWDQPVDWILTENRSVITERVARWLQQIKRKQPAS